MKSLEGGSAYSFGHENRLPWGVNAGSATVTGGARRLLRYIAGLRLAAGRLAVVDATNVRAQARKRNLELASKLGVEAVAVVLDVSVQHCLANNAKRTEGNVPPAVVLGQHRDLEEAIPKLEAEGFSIALR